MFLSPFTHRSPGYEGGHGWPVPLSRKIDLWLWVSIASSAAIIPILQFSNAYSQSTLRVNQGPFGFAIFVIIIFYDTTILILSSKERKITGSVETGRRMDTEVVENVAAASEMRHTINFWILAVCQSGMAALGLYIGARLTLLLWAPIQEFPSLGYVELAFSLGQTGIMMYIAACCIVREIEIVAYLTSSCLKKTL